MNGVDKGFQEKQAASEDISGQREELQQPLEDRQAKTTANCEPEVENVRRMVEEAMLNADVGKMTKWKAEAEKCAAEETRVSKLKAKAESAECKAQAAEREAQAARVVMLEAVSGLEKVAAREVMRATRIAASTARSQAHHANDKAAEAAGKAAQPWV
jgi:hypothetical protein